MRCPAALLAAASRAPGYRAEWCELSPQSNFDALDPRQRPPTSMISALAASSFAPTGGNVTRAVRLGWPRRPRGHRNAP